MQAHKDKKGIGMFFFCNVHFIFYFLFFDYYEAHEGPQQPTTANAGQRMPTAANEGQCRPTQNRYVFFVMLVYILFFIFYFLITTKPTKAYSSQRQPTQVNAGPQHPTKANAGPRR